MKERGGDIRTEVIPNVKMTTLCGVTLRNVEKGSVVSTDDSCPMAYWTAAATSTAP